MPRSFALVAALVTVLTVTACGAAQPTAEEPAPPPSTGAQPAESGAESGQPAPAESAERGEPESSDRVPSTEGSQLRTGTLEAALRTSPGEPGLPADSGASIDDVLRLGAVATWVEAPDVVAVSLPASEGCWPLAGNPAVVSDHELTIAFAVPEICAAPDAARTYTFEVPAGIDPSVPLEISLVGLDYRFTLALPQ